MKTTFAPFEAAAYLENDAGSSPRRRRRRTRTRPFFSRPSEMSPRRAAALGETVENVLQIGELQRSVFNAFVIDDIAANAPATR